MRSRICRWVRIGRREQRRCAEESVRALTNGAKGLSSGRARPAGIAGGDDLGDVAGAIASALMQRWAAPACSRPDADPAGRSKVIVAVRSSVSLPSHDPLGGGRVQRCARVDPHAVKWASAARMASDRLMSWPAAAVRPEERTFAPRTWTAGSHRLQCPGRPPPAPRLVPPLLLHVPHPCARALITSSAGDGLPRQSGAGRSSRFGAVTVPGGRSRASRDLTDNFH